MIKIYFRIAVSVIVSAIMVAFTGCTEPIDIKTGTMDPKLVVHGAISHTDSQTVSVGMTTDYFNPKKDNSINDAEVKIYAPDGNVYQLLNSGANGWYSYSDLHGKPEPVIDIIPGEMKLEVTVNDESNPVGGHFIVSETVLPPVQLDSIKMVPAKVKFFGAIMSVYLLELYFQDPPEENLYMFTFQTNYPDGSIKHGESRNIPTLTLFNDSYFNGEYVKGLRLINASYKSSQLAYPNGNGSDELLLTPGDEVTVRLANLSEGYYRFVDECQRSTSTTNPFFGGPPANIVSNIPGGVGYFTGYIKTAASTIVPEMKQPEEEPQEPEQPE